MVRTAAKAALASALVLAGGVALGQIRPPGSSSPPLLGGGSSPPQIGSGKGSRPPETPPSAPAAGTVSGYEAQKALLGNTLFNDGEKFYFFFDRNYKIQFFDTVKKEHLEFGMRLFPDKTYFALIGTENVIYYDIEISGSDVFLSNVKKGDGKKHYRLLPGNPQKL